MKITSFEIENVKRVRTVAYEPNQSGLTIIGGNNNQGKTSILDAIAWALGGNKYAPNSPQFDGSALPPHIKLTLDNGLIVERKGKNSELYVSDPSGQKYGQKLLDSFVSQLALDLPKFLNMTDKEKADVLLKVIGVGDQLAAIDKEVNGVYNKRQAFYPLVTSKQKYAEELPSYPDAPEQPVSAVELIKRNSEILARNGENQRKRDNLDKLIRDHADQIMRVEYCKQKLAAAQADLTLAENTLEDLEHDIETAQKTVEELVDESTDEITAQLHDIDQINAKVRANQAKEAAQDEAMMYCSQYNAMSAQLEELRKSRYELLKSAHLPLPNLSIEDGCLTYNGKRWGDMSGSDQLIVATSIVKCLNPQCQFVLVDKLEQMDTDTLTAFGTWLMGEGMQVIGTRVSTGNECQIIIEDGMIKPAETKQAFAAPLKDWRK